MRNRWTSFLFGSLLVYVGVAMAHGCGSSGPLFGTGGAGGASRGAISAVSGPSAGSVANPVPDALAESGSRLRVRWRVGDDGARDFVGFYDTLRKEDCFWRLMADDVVRCAPTGWGAGPYFLDNKCAVRVIYNSPCLGAPPYAITNDDSCVIRSRIFAIGQKVPLPATFYYLAANKACVAWIADPAFDFYEIGAEIPPAAFVGSSIVIE